MSTDAELIDFASRLERHYATEGRYHPRETFVDALGYGRWATDYALLRSVGREHEAACRDIENRIAEIEGHPIPWPPPAPEPGTVPPQSARVGLSYYTSLTDPRVNVGAFADRLRDAGAGMTRVWLLDAWAVSASGGTGCYDGFMPWTRDGANDAFDLWSVDSFYLERLQDYVYTLNVRGVVPRLSGLDLYTWSDRKQGMLWVPDAERGPFRNNIQGIRYADDEAFNQIATSTSDHGFLEAFYGYVVRSLVGLRYTVEIGNELPEKPMHERLRDAWRRAGYTGPIAVNRQDDTPGQYANMRIGQVGGYDAIAFHGRRDIEYLDEYFPREPVHRTFQSFLASKDYDPARVTFSSDGCRKSTNPDDAYDYDALREVFADALARGCNVEHQSCMKLRSFRDGRIDLNDLEVDWLRQFAA